MTLPPAGFVGLGAMGGAMAERLLDAGIELHVLDPNVDAVDRLVDVGATRADSPRAVADRAGVVFTSLPTPAICRQVALGDDGLVGGTALKVHVETSTIGRRPVQDEADAMTRAGKALVDAPVSGGPRGAKAGTLATMVAGDDDALDVIRPYLEALMGEIVVVSDRPGLAQVMKLVNNLISAANMAGAFEGLVIGAKAGLDPEKMLDVINASTGRNSATVDKIPKSVLTGSFDYGAHMSIFYKDVTLGLAEAEALGVPTWCLTAIAQLWRFGMEQGGAEEDYTSVIRYIEQWAGVEVRSAPAGREGTV